ncbi:MAG TPA: 4-hydroxybenzoate octaprenyltransferase [Stellaceae bacterium]|nr:4-hydroxybenzoate octaprenyltransferase [Stellaceae bacterium]
MSDIESGDWTDRHAPARWRPYLRLARLDRPIGTWLLLFPGWWAIAMAAPFAASSWLLMALFGAGAVAMRGAGCTLNDIIDRDVDAAVERTRTRPIPSGAVSVREACVFLGLELLLGALVLFSLDRMAILLGLGVLVLVATYPFMKRITYWPQLFLGLNFNWGALMGWAAATGRVELPALFLYVGGIFWTLGYDTIYAHQDKEDDLRIGIKSSALALGPRTRPFLFLFYGAAVAFWGAAGLAVGLSVPFWIGLLLVAALLFHQARSVDLDDANDCRTRFRANRWVGWGMLAAILASLPFH